MNKRYYVVTNSPDRLRFIRYTLYLLGGIVMGVGGGDGAGECLEIEMSTANRFKRLIDSDAVRRAELAAPKHRAERQRKRDRRNIRRALTRLGYHEGYVEKETARLSSMQPHHRRAALVKLRKRLGIGTALAA